MKKQKKLKIDAVLYNCGNCLELMAINFVGLRGPYPPSGYDDFSTCESTEEECVKRLSNIIRETHNERMKRRIEKYGYNHFLSTSAETMVYLYEIEFKKKPEVHEFSFEDLGIDMKVYDARKLRK